MIAAQKKRMTSMKRKLITVIVSAVLILAMAIALIFILDFVKTTTVVDPADGSEYFIRYKEKTYALYYDDKTTKCPTDSNYGYYVTRAGTLIEVNAETGEYEIQAVLEDYSNTEGNEVVGFNFRRLLFPHIEKKNIRSLEVHNDTGSYTFARVNVETGEIDNTSDFIILGSAMTTYDQELFASLYVSAGYTISTRKIENPIKDANGQFTEYGLVAQTREKYDPETGNPIVFDPETGEEVTVDVLNGEEIGGRQPVTYEYSPAYYILTDINGNRYKVIIGDRLVTGGGYYVQYVDMSGAQENPRDAVYVLSSDIGSCLLAPIEDYVTPLISYPMTMNTYFDVEDFILTKRNGKGVDDFEEIVSFSYIDLTERENTISSSIPYVFLENSKSPAASLEGYQPSSDNIGACLQNIYTPSYVGVHKFAPDDEDFVECGLSRVVVDENREPVLDKDGNKQYEFCAEYMISFKYDILDDDGNFVETIQQIILISAPNENGNYYTFTSVYSPASEGKDAKYLYDYNMIVEVEGYSLNFLTWDSYDWINSSYISFNIAFIESIKIESPDYSAQFTLDNSLSDQSEQTSSNLLVVNGSDSLGHNVSTFAQKTVVDKDGVTWVITASDIKAYSASGTELKITSSRYEYNKMGTQVLVDTGGIKAQNGDIIYVYTDEVVTKHPDGSEERVCRFDGSLFRKFYQTFLYATITDSYPMDDATREETLAQTPLLTITIKTTTGEEYVYRFYSVTSRKALITVNGNGEFIVLPTRVQKFITDAQRFFNLELIDATDKF